MVVLAGTLVLLVAATSASAEPAISRPFDSNVDCVAGVDSIGAVVVGGGDYDGDAIEDFAYSAPCSYVDGLQNVGRVWIRNGKNGKLLRRARGNQEGMLLGAALAFVGDLNGDGAEELAVGAPGYDVQTPTDLLLNAGLVRVLTNVKRGPQLKLLGTEANAEFGTSVDGSFNFDDDELPDLVVGAPGQRVSPGGERRGAVFRISGETGAVIDSVLGQAQRQEFGITVTNVGEADDDETEDVLITSEKNPVGGVENAGALVVVSGAAPQTDVFETFGGGAGDRLGASSDSPRTDGRFIVGAPGETLSAPQTVHAGSVALHRRDGTNIFRVFSDAPQANAQFGAAVGVLGLVDDDGILDYVAGAPFHDPSAALPDAGRVSVLAGTNGRILMSIEGTSRGMRLGRSVSGSIDINEDDVPDVISGNPGDTPFLRRDAGTVNVYSGADGHLLRSFKGIHGFETRIFAAGSGATVRGLRVDGVLRGVDATVFPSVDIGELSLAVLDERQRPRFPGSMRIAVGTGHGADDPRVVVLRARAKELVLDNFDAFDPVNFKGGVNVAAGDLDDDGADELVVAQADATTEGGVFVRIFNGVGSDPPGTGGWLPGDSFQAFGVDSTFEDLPINADGANVVVVPLPDTSQRGIAVAPVVGAPVVRVFTAAGDLIHQWLAYDPINFDGVNLAVVDLEGDGKGEIVTAPRDGIAFIRAFDIDGASVVIRGDEVSFQALPTDYTGGARVGAADVDYDDVQEILVAPGPGRNDGILAFEATGAAVAGFTPLLPFGNNGDIAIAGTDRFIRK